MLRAKICIFLKGGMVKWGKNLFKWLFIIPAGAFGYRIVHRFFFTGKLPVSNFTPFDKTIAALF